MLVLFPGNIQKTSLECLNQPALIYWSDMMPLSMWTASSSSTTTTTTTTITQTRSIDKSLLILTSSIEKVKDRLLSSLVDENVQVSSYPQVTGFASESCLLGQSTVIVPHIACKSFHLKTRLPTSWWSLPASVVLDNRLKWRPRSSAPSPSSLLPS